jgi:HAD superfamily hydrolase (TIGR01549 family)
MINAVLFDVGETLLSFGKISTTRFFRQGARASYDFLKACGQPMGNFEYYCWHNLISLRLRHLISSLTGNDFDSSALLKKVGAQKGIELDENQWQHFAWLWYEPLSKIAKTETKISQSLGLLKKMGLKLGIVSNTFINSHSIDKHLEQLGILEFFPVRLYSYQFDFRKPDLRIFRIAAERIGEAVENILYIGDRIDKDIIPALQVGMHAAMISAYTNTGKEPPNGAWKINHFSELPALIEKNNGRKIAITDKV